MKNVAFTFNSESLKLFLQAEKGELVNEGLRRAAIDTFYFQFPKEATDEECHDDINTLLGRYGFKKGVDYEYLTMESYTLYYSIGSIYSGREPTKMKEFESKEAAFSYYEACKAYWFGKVKKHWDDYPHLKNKYDWRENVELNAKIGEIANFSGEVNWEVFDFVLTKD